MAERRHRRFALACALVVIGLAWGGGTTAASNHGISPNCTTDPTGPVYTADSGLTVVDNTDATYATPNASTVTLGEATTVRADGEAYIRVDELDPLCLGNVTAPTPVTVTASEPVTVEGTAAALAVGDGTIAYDASEPLTVTVTAEQPDGSTVTVVADDEVLAETTVGDGRARFTLPAGSHSATVVVNRTDSHDTDDGPTGGTTPTTPPEETAAEPTPADGDSSTTDGGPSTAAGDPSTASDKSSGTEVSTSTDQPGESGPGFGALVTILALATFVVGYRFR